MAHGANSTATSAGFPLYFHKGTQRWCKTIRGRRHYFGKDKQAAYEQWIREKDDLLAGHKPSDDPEVVTVAYLCNYVLSRKQKKVDSGDLSQRQFTDLKTMAQFMVEYFGRNRSVASITPDDFGDLRAKMFERWKPSGLISRIGNIRHFFRVGYGNGLLKDEVRFGDQFAIPSKKLRRQAKQAGGKRLFTAEEIRKSLCESSPHMKAFILLAVNAGLGNSDIAKLSPDDIDLETGWLDYPRPKTAVERRAKLWDETLEAIKEARSSQPKCKLAGEILFVTIRKKPWSNPDTNCCAISQAFRRLTREVDIYASGKTFYALRHVFATVGGDAKDQPALNYAMGHDDGHIGSTYREQISDERLEVISDHVHAWLYRSGGAAK